MMLNVNGIQFNLVESPKSTIRTDSSRIRLSQGAMRTYTVGDKAIITSIGLGILARESLQKEQRLFFCLLFRDSSNKQQLTESEMLSKGYLFEFDVDSLSSGIASSLIEQIQQVEAPKPEVADNVQ